MQHSAEVFVRFRKRVALPQGQAIVLKHVAELLGPPEAVERIGGLVLFEPREHDGNLVLIDIMTVLGKVRAFSPDIRLELFGDPHSLVEIVRRKRPARLWLVIPVWLLLFIGSGLAIMNFHADVSMPEVHRRIYSLLTGKEASHPYWLQVPYSIGIGAGMILFFNHLFKAKFNDEPSPLEVEMYMYQENMNQFVIAEEYRKLRQSKEVRPDEPGSS